MVAELDQHGRRSPSIDGSIGHKLLNEKNISLRRIAEFQKRGAGNRGPWICVSLVDSQLGESGPRSSGAGDDSGSDVGPSITVFVDLPLDQREKFGSNARMLRLQIARHRENFATSSLRDHVGELAQKEGLRGCGRGRVPELVVSW